MLITWVLFLIVANSGVVISDEFNYYLKSLYASLTQTQVPAETWPPSASHKVFSLVMIKSTEICRGKIQDRFVQQTTTGKVDDILQEKYPIQLKDIFNETDGKRKVVLLEGAPGCGKSTLSVYISQQWGEGKLFQEFEYVILVRLRDPAVQAANCIADLLPGRNDEMRKQAAKDITANDGQGVLFILDGWDELPSKESIVRNLVSPNPSQDNPLHQSTVIVTSRPIASRDLHQVVSSCIEILGFTPKELNEYFTDCLNGDVKAVETLLDRIKENPAIAGSCYLPMTASILVHLFKSFNNTLPTTQYGIFSDFVRCCIYHHQNQHTQHNILFDSLDLYLLPENIREPFLFLCKLAYEGVMDDKVIFSHLPADVNTLGLLQGVESFVGQGKPVSYNFFHLSIQEFLAGFYMATQMPDNEQVSVFIKFCTQPCFSPVFQFYAAITNLKLKKPGISSLVINIANKYQYDHQRFLLLFVHCLNEAQDSSLCKSVAQQLQHGLDLQSTTLIPLDCLSIGYFLANACNTAIQEFKVKLQHCSIGDQGCKYLVSGLHKYLDTHSAATTLLNLDMGNNAISHGGICRLSTLLKIGCVSELNLSHNRVSDSEQRNTAIAAFAEQLKHNTTLKKLWLQECGLTSQDAKSLAEALTTNKFLEILYIDRNALCDDGIQHLSHALRVNQGLKRLNLHNCDMTDVGLECIAKSLIDNNVLNEVHMWSHSTWDYPNKITNKKIPFLTECLQNNSTLSILTLPEELLSSANTIQEDVNGSRSPDNMIKVTGMTS